MSCDPHDGLTLEDLAWGYPAMSECASLGHPSVKVPDGERFADYHECICHRFYTDWRGVKLPVPDPRDYL